MTVLTLIANKIAPSGSGVDSLRDCSRVDRVLFDLDSGLVEPGLIQFVGRTFKSTAFTTG